MTADQFPTKDQDVPAIDIIYDPDYWENLAQQRRTQAAVCVGNPKFYTILSRQAEELERLAQLSFKMRQERKRAGRVIGKTYETSGEVVSINSAAKA